MPKFSLNPTIFSHLHLCARQDDTIAGVSWCEVTSSRGCGLGSLQWPSLSGSTLSQHWAGCRRMEHCREWWCDLMWPDTAFSYASWRWYLISDILNVKNIKLIWFQVEKCYPKKCVYYGQPTCNKIVMQCYTCDMWGSAQITPQLFFWLPHLS